MCIKTYPQQKQALTFHRISQPGKMAVRVCVCKEQEAGLRLLCHQGLSGLSSLNSSQTLSVLLLGTIRTIGSLDREGTSHYWLTVLALDLGTVPLSSVTEIYIEVTDTNDNPPQMSRPVFYASVMENSPPNTSVLQLDAFDPDSSSEGKLTFHILTGNPQGFFSINLITGRTDPAQHLSLRPPSAQRMLHIQYKQPTQLPLSYFPTAAEVPVSKYTQWGV